MAKFSLGFISNSSSSSFIIAVKDPKKLKVTIEADLSPYIDGEPIDTEVKCHKYFIENLCCYEDDKDYLAALKAIREGKTILNVSCSSEGDPIEQALCKTGLNEIKKDDNIQIIQGRGGY